MFKLNKKLLVNKKDLDKLSQYIELLMINRIPNFENFAYEADIIRKAEWKISHIIRESKEEK